MAGVGALGAAAFALGMSSHLSLGDAPESVAGVASLGIVHAPGYPLYVAVAHLFSLVLPFGSMALRVNLFSLVCAALSVVGTFRLARAAGASQAGAAVGAFGLALGTSFWFYASFAKHDAFSTLLVVAAAVAVVEWDRGRDRRLLVAAGGLLGLTLGASWQLGALVMPSLAVLIVLGRERGRGSWLRFVRTLALPIATGLVVSGSIATLTLVRAGQDPAVNWGAASTPARFFDLVAMKDFAYVSRRLVTPSASVSTKGAAPGDNVGLARRLRAYPTLLDRELGLGMLLLAGWGAVTSWRRTRLPLAAFLAVTFVVGVVGTAAFIGPEGANGFQTTLVVGGFLVVIFVVVAVWAALGVTDVAGRLGGCLSSGPRSPTRPRPGSPAAASKPAAVAGPAIVAVLAVAALGPSVVVHRAVASHRSAPFAEQYAENVFASLPPGAAILTRGGELTFALVERQIVAGARPDVQVVAADVLAGTSWYRHQLSGVLRMPLPDLGDQAKELVAVSRHLQRVRPVYLDMLTADALRPAIGYRTHGLVAELTTEGQGAQPPTSTDEVKGVLTRYRTDGVYAGPARLRFPNSLMLQSYVRAHLELARIYNDRGQLDELRTQVRLALRVNPRDTTALGVLQELTKTKDGPGG